MTLKTCFKILHQKKGVGGEDKVKIDKMLIIIYVDDGFLNSSFF